MSERCDITLKEVDGPGPKEPGRMRGFFEAIKGLFSFAKQEGKEYVIAKVEQESAKAQQIRVETLARAGEVEIERQRLIAEQEKWKRDLDLQEKQNDQTHKEHLRELYLKQEEKAIEAYRATTERIKALGGLGIKVDVTLTDLDKLLRGTPAIRKQVRSTEKTQSDPQLPPGERRRRSTKRRKPDTLADEKT